MEHLNLNLLRALHALLSTGSVTRAARQLGLTQPAMSRNLAQLRSHFGDPLLVREGNDYLLTERAQRLRPQLQRLMTDIDHLLLQETFEPRRCERTFVLATSDYVAQYIFPELVTRIAQEAPHIRLHYQMGQPDSLRNLGHSTVDLATTVTDEIPDNIYGRSIGQDHPVCLFAQDHPVAGVPLTLEALVRWPHVRITSGGDKDSFLDLQLHQLRRKRQIMVELPFYSAAFNLVSRSRMLLIIPLHVARIAAQSLPLAWAPLPLPAPAYHYYLCWHAIHHNDPAHRWLREQVFASIRESLYAPGHLAAAHQHL